jgi:hypothetical protein
MRCRRKSLVLRTTPTGCHPWAYRVAAVVLLAIAAPRAGAEPLAMHIGHEFRRMSAEDCARKAIAAMIKEKFIRAEIGKDGNAWGVNETTAVKVLAFPYRDGAHVVVVAAGQDNKEAERLHHAIRHNVWNATLDPESPKEHKCDDAGRKPYGGTLLFGMEQRNIIPTLRFFIPAATIVLEKQGLGTNQAGPGLLFGGNQQTAIGMFALPGPNEVQVRVGVIVISGDQKEAERLQNIVRTGVVRVLFD